MKRKVMLQHHGENKVACIKMLRAITGQGLKESKAMSENTPSCVIVLSKEEALEVKDTLESTGATVTLERSLF